MKRWPKEAVIEVVIGTGMLPTYKLKHLRTKSVRKHLKVNIKIHLAI